MLVSFSALVDSCVYSSIATDPADVVVGLVQSSATVTEGDVHYVCAGLQDLPAGGTEREISVTMRTMEITAG